MFISFIYSNVCGFDSFIHIAQTPRWLDGNNSSNNDNDIKDTHTQKKKLKKDESEYLRLILK